MIGFTRLSYAVGWWPSPPGPPSKSGGGSIPPASEGARLPTPPTNPPGPLTPGAWLPLWASAPVAVRTARHPSALIVVDAAFSLVRRRGRSPHAPTPGEGEAKGRPSPWEEREPTGALRSVPAQAVLADRIEHIDVPDESRGTGQSREAEFQRVGPREYHAAAGGFGAPADDAAPTELPRLPDWANQTANPPDDARFLEARSTQPERRSAGGLCQ
jgi:hypothetical protein